jgi:hypothetical protein
MAGFRFYKRPFRRTDLPNIQRVADEHLTHTAYYNWAGLAQAIREQHSDGRLTGEVMVRIEIDGAEYEISESFSWADLPDGDIVHALLVQALADGAAASRRRLIKSPQ